MAERRRDDWKRVAEAEARRREQAKQVCAQYAKDGAKLGELVALDDDVVSAKQKEAYRKELAQVYAPYKAMLGECKASATGGVAAVRMASLPGGTFKMGERGDTVTVRPFQLDVTEVTADAYAACVRAGKCSSDGLQCGEHATYGVSGKGNHPINCVDWNQAAAYCQWAGKRLPTEEEWEWAARGQAAGTTYPWGNDPPSAQLCWKRGNEGTCAVGGFPEGGAPGGIHDLAGNVVEWTASNYDANDATTRVVRGGSWYLVVADYVRAASRVRIAPGLRGVILGFRCAR